MKTNTQAIKDPELKTLVEELVSAKENLKQKRQALSAFKKERQERIDTLTRARDQVRDASRPIREELTEATKSVLSIITTDADYPEYGYSRWEGGISHNMIPDMLKRIQKLAREKGGAWSKLSNDEKARFLSNIAHTMVEQDERVKELTATLKPFDESISRYNAELHEIEGKAYKLRSAIWPAQSLVSHAEDDLRKYRNRKQRSEEFKKQAIEEQAREEQVGNTYDAVRFIAETILAENPEQDEEV